MTPRVHRKHLVSNKKYILKYVLTVKNYLPTARYLGNVSLRHSTN